MKQENQCGAYIKHINDVLQKESNNALQKKGLTMSQLIVLHQLENTPNGEMPLKELEKNLQVAQSTTAGIISRLEQKGFVEGYGSAEDKRIKIVRITESGHKCFMEAQIYSLESEKHLLTGLTESECDMFNILLKKVSENLKKNAH